jgi:hypothetical protein
MPPSFNRLCGRNPLRHRRTADESAGAVGSPDDGLSRLLRTLRTSQHAAHG